MTFGTMAIDTEQRIDFDAMRRFKLARRQAEPAAKNLGGLLCFDPDNKQTNERLQASIDVVRPGIATAIAAQWPTAKQLGFDNKMQALGLADWRGLGLSNHERPFVSRAFSMDNPEDIEPGMHFALETFCGEGADGARLESQLIVTATRHRVVSKRPIERLMVCHPW